MKSLVKIQIKNMFNTMKNGGKHQRSGVLIVVLYSFFALMFVGLFVGMWSMLLPICEAGYTWFYFSLAGLMALALSIFGSVFMTQTQMYDAKDNELLLSMPIRPHSILLSRLAVLLGLTAMFTLLVFAPACGVYAAMFGATLPMVVGWIAIFFGLVFLGQGICCALGWLLHKLLSHMRNKAVASLVYMVLFLAAYFYVYGNANNILSSLLVNSAEIAGAVEASAWPLYAIGAACTGDLLQTLLFAVLCAAVFALVFWRLSASFIKTVNGGKQKKDTRRKAGRNDTRPRVAVVAVMHKELRRFLTSSVYLTNMGLGIVIAVVLPIAALLFRAPMMEYMGMLEGMETILPALVAAVMAFVIATAPITSPSVSMEGANLWIVRVLPISGRTLLRGKLLLHCVLTVPVTVVSAAALALIVGCTPLDALINAAIAATFAVFVGLAGLLLNLMSPKFDWTNEAYPCKQALPVMLSIFGSYAVAALLGALYAVLMAPIGSALALLVCVLILFAADCVLYTVLIGWGARRFESFPA